MTRVLALDRPSLHWLTVVALALGAPRTGAAQTPAVTAPEQLGYVLGEADAAIEIVEFADFACDACAEFARDTWPRVRSELVETGRVRWRVVPFVFGFRLSDESALAAECAGEQSAFWAMHDLLYDRQAEWNRRGRPEEAFRSYAAELGLDIDHFRTCVDDEVPEPRIRRQTRAARAVGLRATPTFLIDGRPVLGALPWAEFLAVVEAAEARGG